MCEETLCELVGVFDRDEISLKTVAESEAERGKKAERRPQRGRPEAPSVVYLPRSAAVH